MINATESIPFYQKFHEHLRIGDLPPILEKGLLQHGFPESWLNPEVEQAIKDGRAEFVTTTGTNHDRMQLIRPPFFLMKQYLKIWEQHPDLCSSWHMGCMRISLTTVRATQHITKIKNPTVLDRIFGGRTLYLNMTSDPYDWSKDDLLRMISEIQERAPYHLDGDPFYIAYFIKKLKEYDLWEDFPKPQTVIHAYELCTKTVSAYIAQSFHCPVINLYGSTELGFLWAIDYEKKSMTFYHDQLELELIPIAPLSDIKSLIVTSFRNPFMPLIRYRSGDCVKTSDGSCDPKKIIQLCGREKELWTMTTKHLSHACFDDILWNLHPSTHDIFIYQLQTHMNKSTQHLRFIYHTFTNRPLNSMVKELLRKKLHDLHIHNTGSIQSNSIEIEYCQHIPPVPSGKYAWIIKQGMSYDGKTTPTPFI